VFIDPLPSNERPTVAHVRFRGNVFTESLSSNEVIHYNIHFCRIQKSKIAALKIYLLRFQFDGSNQSTIAVRNKESSMKRGCKHSYKLCVKYYL
jgi:hypothetical protein